MKNLLRYEFHRLFRYIPYYVLLGLAFLFFMFIYSIFAITRLQLAMPAFNTFGTIGQAVIAFYLSQFIVVFVTEDYKGTRKNVISRGYSKTKVYFSNYIVTMTAAVGGCLALVLLLYLYNGFIGYSFALTPDGLAGFGWGTLGQFVYFQIVYFGAVLTTNRSSGICLGIIFPILIIAFFGFVQSVYVDTHYVNLGYPPEGFPQPFHFSPLFFFYGLEDSYASVGVVATVRVLLTVFYTALPCGIGYLINRKRDM